MYAFFAEWLPLLNTTLILASGAFLLVGYGFIRRKQIERHRRAMLAALVLAALFLAVYVTRALLFPTKIFAGEGAARALYLTILVSHTALAIAVGPLALATLRRALRAEYGRHRRLGRITLPIWLYVVATGWTIYLMLHSFA
jgi:putative membrane protein